MSRRAVSIENLHVYYHNEKILNSISLEAYEGDIVCVFGSTGSGKTTFLKTLVGLIQSIYSRFKVYGYINIFGYKPEEALVKGLTAYVPQDVYSFFVGQTPEEELAIIVDTAVEILKNFGLELGRKIYELSDGQLYRLLTISAISCGAKVIAIDEPSSHIDWWKLEEVLDYLRGFAIEKNLVIFLADHRIDKVKKFCDKYIFLSNVGDIHPLPRVISSTDNSIIVASLEDIELCYNSKCVLRRVSMEVRGGEAVAIVGRNGVGKTTLFRVIAGLTKPSRGSVRFYNKPRVFMVPQNPVYWFPNKSLEKVFRLFVDMSGVEESVEEVLSMFNLDRYRNRDAYSLSVGLARVLSIALAYASKADLVLIDEPTLGLDHRSKRIVVEAINKLVDRGCSVIIATHDMDFARLFNRVYLLDNGVLRSFDGVDGHS